MWKRLNNCNAYEMYETRPAPVVLPTTTARQGLNFWSRLCCFAKMLILSVGKNHFLKSSTKLFPNILNENISSHAPFQKSRLFCLVFENNSSGTIRATKSMHISLQHVYTMKNMT